MARLARPEPSSDGEAATTPRAESSRQAAVDSSISPSPVASFSSDKENRTRQSNASSKRKSTETGHPDSSTPATESSSATTNKRRRLTEQKGKAPQSQTAHEKQLEEVNDTEFYDPDQNPEERRAVRKGLRDLTKDLNDSRSEYLQSASRGLAETVEKANELFKNVKQTSDATIDSRLLVTAADLSYKKTAQLALGDASAGIDVDEFVSKCITFMRQGPISDEPEPNTQRQGRSRRTQVDDDDEVEDENNGDALNWDWLGRQACFPHNTRPPVSGFLLGPLSVQKKVRQQTQRKAREARQNPANATRPEEIEAKDLEQSATNLTTQCQQIVKLLRDIQVKGQEQAEQEYDEHASDEATRAMLDKYNLSDTGGVPLFKFCVNPKSFGQTVENLFYVSFMIKEGKIGIDIDSRGFPTLILAGPGDSSKEGEPKERGSQRRQVVFNLDFPTWESLIEEFDIEESLIPHRAEANTEAAATGWYA